MSERCLSLCCHREAEAGKTLCSYHRVLRVLLYPKAGWTPEERAEATLVVVEDLLGGPEVGR